MKQGDLVKLNELSFPQYKGMLGVLGVKRLSRAASPDHMRWIVFIDNKWHPYIVDEWNMELVNEAR